MFRVRPLTIDDVEHYQALRAEALEDTPHAFLASPGDDRAEDTEGLIAQISNPAEFAIAVAEPEDAPGLLIASAGIIRAPHLKARHRAMIWGVYCTPTQRRTGAAKACLELTLDIARSWNGVEVVALSVSAETPSAIALYKKLGFQPWGLEPDAIRIAEKSFDELYLQRRL